MHCTNIGHVNVDEHHSYPSQTARDAVDYRRFNVLLSAIQNLVK